MKMKEYRPIRNFKRIFCRLWTLIKGAKTKRIPIGRLNWMNWMKEIQIIRKIKITTSQTMKISADLILLLLLILI